MRRRNCVVEPRATSEASLRAANPQRREWHLAYPAGSSALGTRIAGTAGDSHAGG